MSWIHSGCFLLDGFLFYYEALVALCEMAAPKPTFHHLSLPYFCPLSGCNKPNQNLTHLLTTYNYFVIETGLQDTLDNKSCWMIKLRNYTSTFTFRAFSRRFNQIDLLISVIKIYCCLCSKEVHRTKCQALTTARLTHSPYTTKIARIRCCIT